VHHGAISAENALPGLRVWIRIPIFRTTAIPAVQQPSALPSHQLSGLKNS
jgi:hypothetical protein